MTKRLKHTVFFKKSGIILLLLTYLFTSCIFTVLPVGSVKLRRIRTKNTTFFAKLALALFGVHVRLNRNASGGYFARSLVVSNHVSYIDVLVIASLFPSVFVTSEELRETFLLGALARFGGSIFIERRKPTRLKQEIEAISKVLGEGFTVVLFPEGTTSNGDEVRPFKNSLFTSGIQANAKVLPLCLRYAEANEEPVSRGNRDKIYYYGGVTFFNHFPRFLSLQSVAVEVTPLKGLAAGPLTSRKELAARAHNSISAAYRGDPISDIQDL